MSHAALSALLTHCHTLCLRQPKLPDAELLRQFVPQRDAAAFEQFHNRYAPPMALGKAKLALLGLIVVLATGAVCHARTTPAPKTPTAGRPQAKVAAKPKNPPVPRVRTDRHGDPLPTGAIARLGTARWRHGFVVESLAYSPDGKIIAASGSGRRGITLWDAATGKELRRLLPKRDANPLGKLFFLDIGKAEGLAFSPDSKTLASTDHHICHHWNAATGKERLHWVGDVGTIFLAVAFSPDGHRAAAVSTDRKVQMWNGTTGAQQRIIDCGKDAPQTVAFSPDGKLLASLCQDGSIRMWEVTTGKDHRRLTAPKKATEPSGYAAVFSPDGKLLASGCSGDSLRLWNVASGRQVRALGTIEGLNVSIAFSPDGKLLACGDFSGIRFWDVAGGAEKRSLQPKIGSVTALAFSPDGKTLAVGGMGSGGIRLWDMAMRRERFPAKGHEGLIFFLRFSPDGAALTSIGVDKELIRWDLATGAPRQQFSGFRKGILQCTLSPDGHTLAAGRWSGEVRLWDVRTGKPGRVLGKHQEMVGSVAFSPDGRLVASGGKDHVIHIWDVPSGKEVGKIEGFKNEVAFLRFSPDGKALACRMRRQEEKSIEPTLRLWDVASGKERWHFDGPDAEDALIFSGELLSFSPDGKTLASGYSNRTKPEESMIHLWDTMTGKELRRLSGFRGLILSLAFSPDGKRIASGEGSEEDAEGNSVRLWDAATGRLLRRFEGHHSYVTSVAFSPDGRTLASGAGDSTILLWDISDLRTTGR